MCFFNSALGRYYSLHTVLVFILSALLAGWWQQQSADLAFSALFFDETAQQFRYTYQSLIYFFGKYAIWGIPFGGAVMWTAYALKQAEALNRSMYLRIATFFFSAPLVMGALKQFTAMPRPFLLQEFGGELLLPQHFWASGFAQGGGALPSVHATCGFIFLALYYLGWVKQQPMLRWSGLILALLAGFFFGFLRIAQGYHTLSQVLWAGAFVWLYASLWFLPVLKQAGVISPLSCSS